jgi:hypothetical protein
MPKFKCKSRRKSVVTSLLDLALGTGLEVWHTSGGDAYSTIRVGGHREHWPVKSRGFRRWLSRLYFLESKAAPSSQALQDAIGVLEGQSLFDSDELPVFVRVAEHGDGIYLDLCDAGWRAIRITAAGWSVVKMPPVRFRRAKAMLALPEPTPGGSITDLRQLLNVSDKDWPLVVAWLLACFRPIGPYPVLCLHGEQGSAKSTAARVLRSLVDPNCAPLRCEPREPRDLMIAANNGWTVALDNVSHLWGWLSDALCRLSTGGGFATRTLYGNDEETIFDSQRPVILTGIEEVATRGDLLDRCLLVNQPTIREKNRLPEAAFWANFNEIRPMLLGAVLSAVSSALNNIGTVKITALPRMADFALWAVAGESALDLRRGEFMKAYGRNREATNESALESSPVAKVVMEMMNARTLWRGTATELLSELEKLADEKTMRLRIWPATPRALAGVLKRLAPNLRQVGVEVETGGHTGRGRLKKRAVTLKRIAEETTVPNVPTVPGPEKCVGDGDDKDENGNREWRKTWS